MKLYEECITWYNQGIVVERKFCGYEFFEEEPHNEFVRVTWETLDRVCDNFGPCIPFYILNHKKNRVIKFWDGELFGSLFCDKEYRPISTKKYPVLPLTYKITYEKVNNLSIKDILEIAPAEKAIKYLAERGLNIEK